MQKSSNNYGAYLYNTTVNMIGGTTAGAGNVISGNDSYGVFIYGGEGNTLQGNLIGTDVTGMADLGNNYGVYLSNTTANTIGGTTAGAGNVISGNNQGVYISAGQGNALQGNFIGTDVTGTADLGNRYGGVNLSSTDNTIGGTTDGAGNTIAFNDGDGVHVHNGTNNAIRGNSIFSNADLGIDLGLNGVLPNDPGDADAGANNFQNYPVLDVALGDGSRTIVRATLDSTPNTTFNVDLYANTAADPSGHGEGETFLGSTAVTTDDNGRASFTVTLAVAVPPGRFITATATDPDGNTSEFSQAVAVTPALIVNLPAGGQDVAVATDGTDGTHLTVTQDGTVYSALLNDVSALVLNGSDDIERVEITIDGLTSTNLSAGMWITGGEGVEIAPNGDTLVVKGSTEVTNYEYTTGGPEEGTIEMDGLVVRFFEFEPLIDQLSVVNRTFTIGDAGNKTIYIADSTSDSGSSTIYSGGSTQSFESLIFKNPTATLAVNSGDGDDTVFIEQLDADWEASLTVNAEGGNDTVNASAFNHPVKLDGGKGNDDLFGGSDDDELIGGDGDDNLAGGPGIDNVDGGDGSNIVFGDLDDCLTFTEGDTLHLQALFSNPESATIDWDDGSPVEAGIVDQIAGTISGSHLYADEGQFTVTVTVIDTEGNSTFDSMEIPVDNALPLVEAGPDQTVDEGGPVIVHGSFVDPGLADTHTFLWEVAASNGQTVADGTEEDFSFIPTDAGTYTLTFTVTDNNGGIGQDSMAVTVANVTPVVDAGSDATVDEGDTFTASGSFADPGINLWTATVDYGDGSPTEDLALNPDGTFNLQHAYVDDGTYIVTVTVADDNGGLGTDTLNVTVDNVAPTVEIEGAPGAVFVETMVTVFGSVSDPGVTDAFTYAWDVTKDGSPFASGTDSLFIFTPDEDEATYVVTLTVTDNGGSAGTDSKTIVAVAAGDPLMAISGPDGGVRGQTRTLTLYANDPSAGPDAQFTYAIDFNGDGSVDQTVSGPGRMEVSHVYTDVGTYTVEVTATAQGGDVVGTKSHSIEIGIVELQDDPLGEGKVLAVGGTLSGDDIKFSPGEIAADVEVTFNGASLGVFSAASRLLAFGQDGDDIIEVAGSITLSAWLYGEAGNDRLKGGAGHDVLLGGYGDDLLVGKDGRDLLIGGIGSDRIIGNADDDILIAGTTIYDGNPTALDAIMREWTRSDMSYEDRIASLLSGIDIDDVLYWLENGNTVLDDGDSDKLTGSSGLDWFWLNQVEQDRATDLKDECFAMDLEWILS